MAEPFVGEIRLFSFNTIPRGWAACNGQIMQINQNQALFSILSNRFGGDGKATFALPNLQGRTPLHPSSQHALGESGGEAKHTLTVQEIPAHTHQVAASSNPATATSPTGNAWAATAGARAMYTEENSNTTMANNALGMAGSSQGHNNMQPYTILQFCIATSGIFPPHN